MVVCASGDGEGESLLDKLNPLKKIKKAQESAAIEKSRVEANKLLSDEQGEQIFGTGLMGKLATGMVNKIGGAVKEQFQEAQRSTMDTWDAAVRAVESDMRLKEYLGADVSCTQPMSQASASTNINGVATNRTTIGFMAQGLTTGRAAQVEATSETGSDGTSELKVVVRLDDGQVFEVGMGAASLGGDVIDISADDVIDV